MGIDVAELLAQYEQAPTSEPMHGQRGQVRRNPSADQKKVRRQMTVQKKAEIDRTIAQLLRRASVAPTLAEQQDCMVEVERLKTAQLAHYDADRALDLTIKESAEIIPHGNHELTSGQSDWLLDGGLSATASTTTEAEHALVTEAALWFERVPDYVKVDPAEFGVQAHNLARRTASQYGDHAEAAQAAFQREAERLWRQARKTGSLKTAALLPNLDGYGHTEDPRYDPPHSFETAPPRPDNQDVHVADPHEAPKSGPYLDTSLFGHEERHEEHPFIQREIDRFKSGEDAAGVREHARGWAGQQVAAGLDKAASLQPGSTESDLAAVLAGFEPKTAGPLLLAGEVAGEAAGAGEAAAGAGEAASAGGGAAAGDDMEKMPGMPGGDKGGHGGAPDNGGGSGSDASGVADDAHGFAQQQITGSSQVNQVGAYGQGGTEGYPTATFPSFGGDGPEPNTSSNRSPALNELANFTGWDGTSVVPQGDTDAADANEDTEGTRDASQGDSASQGFPVSGSQNPGQRVASRGSVDQAGMAGRGAAGRGETRPVGMAGLSASQAGVGHTGSHNMKESTMDHAACPTCSGTGHVAVRRQAYSGLPQIDQIVDADETPSTQPAPGQSENYPGQVAFPVDPNWGTGGNVQNAIQQTEQQVNDRNSRSPLLSGSTSSRRQANGRDNSGWIGDMGSKGVDYPGYSTPAYDGSSSTGYADPVYQNGGDNTNQPLKPYGEMEANDDTNNPPEPFQYGVPHNNDQSFRQVTPAMSTAGSRDPFIAQAQAEQARLQGVIAARQRQLGRG